MRTTLYILTTCFLFQTCKQDLKTDKAEPIKYWYINYVKDDLSFNTRVSTVYSCTFSQTISDSVFILKYIFQPDSFSFDTIVYILKEDENFEPKCLCPDMLVFVSDRTYLTVEQPFRNLSEKIYSTTEQTYRIFKYAQRPEKVDACLTIFWSPKLGIILKRSTTWGQFQKLQTNNDSINEQINKLTELIYQDIDFYYGCTEERELIPKDDIDEFYKWKQHQNSDKLNKK